MGMNNEIFRNSNFKFEIEVAYHTFGANIITSNCVHIFFEKSVVFL